MPPAGYDRHDREAAPQAAFQGQLDPDPGHHFPEVDFQLFAGDMTPTRVATMQGKIGERARDFGLIDSSAATAWDSRSAPAVFPMMHLSYAWGSERSHHMLATVDASLLGGSGRPSLH